MSRPKVEFNKDRIWYMLLLLIIFISIFATVNYFKFDILKGYKISYRNMYNKYLSDKNIEEIRSDLNIKDIDYKWSEELVYNNKPIQIIYHHAASSIETPEEINEFHKSRGWSGIGYNYYIRKDGTIYSGRPEGAEGAHTIGQNKNSIGICLEGNFEEEELTSEQIENLYKLSIYISLKYD
ncbi:MAG: N-acetylmuramoyl-L-alanine amidase, partial [Clostridium sp.]